MQNEGLRQALERLRSELDSDVEPAVRARIDALITDVEHSLENPDDEEHQEKLADHARDLLDKFMLEHPRVTNILNQIMETLGDAGI